MSENAGQPAAIQRATRGRLAVKDRQRQALERRLAGDTYEQIASAVGYRAKSAAFKAVEGALRDVTREPAEALRDLEMLRLDELYRAASPEAKAGDPVMIAACLRISESRRKLLGLDGPPKPASGDAGQLDGVSDAELEAMFAQLCRSRLGEMSEAELKAEFALLADVLERAGYRRCANCPQVIFVHTNFDPDLATGGPPAVAPSGGEGQHDPA